ncbi:hypothetical protein FQA39_LY05324 [Lamprigera yunnana]|nr:hypothetical protein FQA39_LY05324 [Lamprigera yunnana]
MKNVQLYVLFFIFSVVFGFNPLLLPVEENNDVQDCVSNFVLQEFTKNRPIYHVHDGSKSLIIPYVGNNPYIIIDINKPINKAEHYASYYIFQTANRRSFRRMFKKMLKYNIWDYPNLRDRKCLIIASNSKGIVPLIVRFATYIAVYNYTNEIYTCNPYHKGNQCGTKCNILTKHQCNTNNKYFETTESYPNCSIDLIHEDYRTLNVVFLFILKEFAHYLGFSLNIIQPNDDIENSNAEFMVFPGATIDNRYGMDPFYTLDFGWLTFAKKIPSTRILKYIFEQEVWILIGVTLLSTSLTWCLITKLTTNRWNVETSFTNVLALTLVGCFPNLPQLRPLKCLIVWYLMFIVIIQTAFKTDLAELLTVDQYERSITNLRDLAESDVPLCSQIYVANFHFKNILRDDPVYTKIKNRLFLFKNNSDILEYRNCTYLMVLDDILDVKHKISPKLDEVNNHLSKTLNRFIQRVTENGITQHVTSNVNNKRYAHDKRIEKEESGTKVITMEHVYCSFIIWVVGMALSVIVFIVEIVSQRIAKK